MSAARETYYLIYDVVSSRNRTVLFRMDGTIARERSFPIALPISADGRATQPPAVWDESIRENTRAVLDGIDPTRVAAIGLTAQSEVCVFLGADGKPLMDSLNWADRRGEVMPPPPLPDGRWQEITAGNCGSRSVLQKIRFVKERQPALYDATACILNCKDYLAYLLTGVRATDDSDAAQLGCYDFAAGGWSAEILEAAGIDPRKLPCVVPSASVMGRVSADAARRYGLAAGTPVVMGGGDCLTSGLGAGAWQAGDAYLHVGSSVWLGLVSKGFDPRPDVRPRVRNYRYLLPDTFVMMTNTQEFGTGFKWLKNRLFQYDPAFAGDTEVYPFNNIDPYACADALLQASPAGANGLQWIPFLMGESPAAVRTGERAAFLNVSWQHTRADFVRAVLEGGGYLLTDLLRRLEALGAVKRVFVSALGSRSDILTQTLADILGRPLQRVTIAESTDARGAALLCELALGTIRTPEEADFWREARTFAPDPERHALYQKGGKAWRESRAALASAKEE